jgi:hypothetical protein
MSARKKTAPVEVVGPQVSTHQLNTSEPGAADLNVIANQREAAINPTLLQRIMEERIWHNPLRRPPQLVRRASLADRVPGRHVF